MKSEMAEDTREIFAVNDDEGGVGVACVGYNFVTKIECYAEPGAFSEVAYIRIWKGEHLWMRRIAVGLSIVYREATQ